MTKKSKTAKSAEAAPRILDAPLAVASDGTVLIGIAWIDHTAKAIEVAQKLLAEGRSVFIGVAVPKRLNTRLARDMEDAAADIVGRLGPKVLRLRRR
ncbi:MAG: hypothetical protein ACHREM_31405 [Polyangiales bacterium]